jgi:hypothetical protein
MKRVDKLLKQATTVAGIRGNDLDFYDFRKLTIDELKELAYDNPSEERFRELSGKARKE